MKDKTKKSSKYQKLVSLAKNNGRYVGHKGGLLLTADITDGSDVQYFDTIAEAIAWEKGYITMR